MTLKGKKITVHDMTLRDGMHPKRHQMTLAQMKSIACGLDAAGALYGYGSREELEPFHPVLYAESCADLAEQLLHPQGGAADPVC